MCGRMNFDHKHSKVISEFFGCDFSAPSNNNLSPGQSVATLVSCNSPDDSGCTSNEEPTFQQLDATWGIQFIPSPLSYFPLSEN
jgi:hypothetical protein